jgi:hypothetical protein
MQQVKAIAQPGNLSCQYTFSTAALYARYLNITFTDNLGEGRVIGLQLYALATVSLPLDCLESDYSLLSLSLTPLLIPSSFPQSPCQSNVVTAPI